jgi:hypothetical protein
VKHNVKRRKKKKKEKKRREVRSHVRVTWNKLVTAKCLSNVKCEENSRKCNVPDKSSDGIKMLLGTRLREIMFSRRGSCCFVFLLFS